MPGVFICKLSPSQRSLPDHKKRLKAKAPYLMMAALLLRKKEKRGRMSIQRARTRKLNEMGLVIKIAGFPREIISDCLSRMRENSDSPSLRRKPESRMY
jgi:hypothetical protein